MEKSVRRIYTQAEGAQNSLVVEIFEDEQMIPYCCKIMENNSIPGLLPARHQILDGVYILKYNISGKLRLDDYLMQNRLNYEKGVILLRNLTDALLHLSEYFLSAAQCILEPQQVFVGDGMRPYLICLPLKNRQEQDSAQMLQKFYEKLLSNYFATAQCSDYDEMFKWVYRAAPFDLVAFRERFLKVSNEIQYSQAEERQLAREKEKLIKKMEYGSESALNAEKLEIKGRDEGPAANAPIKAGVLNIPGGESFAVPQAAPNNEKKAAKAKKQKEKKSIWPFGARAKNKKEASVAVEQPVVVSQPAEQKYATPPQQLDHWEGGTICVAEEGKTIFAGETHSIKNGCYLLHQGKKVVIDRLPFSLGKANASIQTDYAVYHNDKVSRRHATILQGENGYMLHDDKSLNGTFLNGRRLEAEQTVPLSEGDEIGLYDEILIFHLGR